MAGAERQDDAPGVTEQTAASNSPLDRSVAVYNPDAPPGGDVLKPGGGVSLRDKILRRLTDATGAEGVHNASRRELARQVSAIVSDILKSSGLKLDLSQQRDLITGLLDDLLANPASDGPAKVLRYKNAGELDAPSEAQSKAFAAQRAGLAETKSRVQPILMERIDITVISELPRLELEAQITDIIGEILAELKLQLNRKEQQALVGMLLDDMLGLGPLEPLLADESINDILVNGPDQVYVERAGKLELTDIHFRDNAHVMNIATRIVTRIGRRIDETTPLVDARLEDGSRVNIIAPPLAIDGTSISIRKFSKKSITLDTMKIGRAHV